MSVQAIKKLTEKIEQLESRVEQLYKAHYNPPTNNDLQKSLNDLLDDSQMIVGIDLDFNKLSIASSAVFFILVASYV